MVGLCIFGANGMLGNTLVKYFSLEGYDVLPVTRNEVDASKVSFKELNNFLAGVPEGTVVINCIGMIPQKFSMTDLTNLEEYIRVNTLFPHLLGFVCQLRNLKCFHITTDCVYDGKNGPYHESDRGTETNIYGVTKYCGEYPELCIIRTSIIGEEVSGFRSLLEWVRSQSGKTISGFTNHFWNGLTCLEVGKVIEHCIRNGLYWEGVKIVSSPDTVSKYELCQYINRVYNLNITIEPKEHGECPTDKSLIMDSEFSKKLCPIPEIYDQIQEQYEFFR